MPVPGELASSDRGLQLCFEPVQGFGEFGRYCGAAAGSLVVCGSEGLDCCAVVAALVVPEGRCFEDGGGAAGVSHALAGIVGLGQQVVCVLVLAGEGGEAGGKGACRGYSFLVADLLVGVPPSFRTADPLGFSAERMGSSDEEVPEVLT